MLPGEPARSKHRRLGAILLLGVLLFAPLVPSGGAQQVPERNLIVVTFDKTPAVYNESEPVVIELTLPPAAPTTADTVRVFCETGCPAGEVRTYSSAVTQRLVFPTHFCQLVNNVRDCVNYPTPTALREPRWNGTWAVSLRDGLGVEIYRANFRVELTDAWRYNYTMEPTQTLWVRPGGFVPGSLVQISFGKVEPSGREFLFRNLTMPVGNGGRTIGWWNIPKEEAFHVQCDRCRRYFVELRADPAVGNTKVHEKVYFFVQPAVIVNKVIAAPNLLTRTEFERTESVPYVFSLTYPDSSGVGTADFGDPPLEVNVERVDPGGGGLVVVKRLEPTYLSGGVWEANWTIPRDLVLKTPAGKAYEFRLILHARKDFWGNHIPENSSHPFTVNPATLEARFEAPPTTLERSDIGRWRIVTLYHDGQPFDNKVNGTWLSGSFVRINDQGEAPVPDSTVRARWKGDAWEFAYEFTRGYEPLGRHAFRFHGEFSANDTWGNYVESNRSGFVLGKALPRVVLTEKSGKDLLNATTGWGRGQRVDFTAKITYGNGSAYSSARNVEGAILNATLTKRRGPTEFVEMVVVPFRVTSDVNGLWSGSVQLSLTERETPLGNWTLSFPMEDHEGNGGSREFHRAVRSALLRVEPHNFPKSAYLLGERVAWTFTLVYPDGKLVTDQDIPFLAVDVYRWSGEKILGLEQGSLGAEFRPEKHWRVGWTPTAGLRLGEFVLVPRGTDRFGNPVGATRSDPVRIYVPTINREVLLQPPPTVARNETVYVMVDAITGDTGEDEKGCPRIAVERWSRDRWIIEVEDVLLGRCKDGEDHFASWTTTASTTLGTYRFRFSGRDSLRAYLNATSSAFTVVPLNASRPIILQPLEEVVKGVPARMEVRHLSTDQFLGAWVLRFGQRLTRAEPQSGNLTTWVATWKPEFLLTGGEYQIEILGRDKDGNDLRVTSRPFSVSEVEFECRVMEDVPAAIARNQKLRFTFRCLLPDATVVTGVHGAPTVTLRDAEGDRVTEVVAIHTMPTWEVAYTPPLDLPVGTYRFEVGGRDVAGNLYPSVLSGNFSLAPGGLVRPWVSQPAPVARLETLHASARSNRTDDPTVTCVGAFLGNIVTPQAAADAAPIGTVEVEWTPNPGKGTHEIRWNVPIDAVLGWYRLDCEGRDESGNAVTWKSSPFQVNAARIAASRAKDGAPDAAAFVAGQTHVFRASIAYSSDRSLLTPERAARVDAFFTLEGRPVEQRPTVEWDPEARVWVLTWEAPAVLPPGTYTLYVTGADRHNNALPANRIADYKVAPEIGERLFGIPGFDRAVPSVPPLLAAAVAVAAAIFLLRQRVA